MDLFSSSATAWRADPSLALLSWLKEKSLSSESVKIYQFMLGKLFRWLESREIDLFHLGADDLIQFLNENQIQKGQRRRYARLVERLFDDFAGQGFTGDNPGRMVVFMGETREKNAATTFLGSDDRHRLTGYLEDMGSRGSGFDEELRNAGILALAMGVGARASEIPWVRVGDVVRKAGAGGVVSCGGVGVRLPDGRLPRVMPCAWGVLQACAEGRRERDALVLEGKGKPHDATLFRWAREALKAAGVELDRRACVQTLRNTYIAMLFEEGECDEAIMAFAGIASQRGLNLLRAAINAC